MLNPTYDETRTREALDQLRPSLRVAFAAACAERLLSALNAFLGGSQDLDLLRLREIADQLWHHLEGKKMAAFEVENAIAVCMAMIEQFEGESSNWQDNTAADAAAAVCYALQCCKTGDSKEAAWASKRAYEALDAYVIDRDGIDTNEPDSEQRVLSNPLIQSELARQRRDLDALLNGQNQNAVVSRLREQAKTEGQKFFG